MKEETSGKRAHEEAFDSGEFDEDVYPRAGPASARKTSKKRHKDDAAEVEPERRLKVYRKQCPKSVREREERVRMQRFFCVARNRTGVHSEEFQVLGSVGNVYTVTIDNIPRCSCPDGAKGNTCKHIVFIMLKVLRIPSSSNLWYQAGLLNTELAAIFAHARPALSSSAEQRAAKAYKIAIGEEKPDPSGSNTGLVEKRLPTEGDSCPVCYEDFDVGSEQGLVFCLALNGCGNGIHAECFAQWAKQAQPVTCVSCRAEWKSPASSNAAAGPSYSEGYLNLADQTGLSRKRDVSTYYHGPQRGKRWDGGYGRYENGDYGGGDYGYGDF